MATLPVPPTQAANAQVTSTLLNKHRDAGEFGLGSTMTGGGGRRALARLRQTVAQSIATGGTGAAVTFDAEDFDYDNGHSTVTNTSRYTGATAGKYLVVGKAGLVTPASATGTQSAWIAVNGTEDNGTRYRVPGSTVCGLAGFVFDVVTLNGTTDYVELWIGQGSGGSVLTDVGPGFQSSMIVYWLSN